MRDNALWITLTFLGLSALCFMTLGARGNWAFVLEFRGAKLLALMVVGASVSTSTLLFQTITQNRILTPSIMGFDALFVLILTAAVFVLGSAGYVALPEGIVFAFNLVVMIGASLLLFGTLLGQHRSDLMRMILTGIIFGVFFRSLTAFMQRLIDPNDFITVQVSSFANFNRVHQPLLAVAVVLSVAGLIVAWRMRHVLDVLALGHDAATNLGASVPRRQMQVLILVAMMVAISTALVGPVVFLGLLVVSLARAISPTQTHASLVPLAAAVGGVVLVGGQTIMERVFGFATPLAVVVDFIGGVVFLFLVLRKGRE